MLNPRGQINPSHHPDVIEALCLDAGFDSPLAGWIIPEHSFLSMFNLPVNCQISGLEMPKGILAREGGELSQIQYNPGP